ncbi:MAG: Hsp33 family molecular chaperone HslO [Pseudobdellovibrionaceae bacterium]
MPKERVHRFVSNDFTVRAAAVNATAVVREMQKLHQSYPIPTVAVGRAMVGALLLASHLKEDQKVGLLFRGSGEFKSVYAEAQFNGQVRGYTPQPYFEPANYQNGLKVGMYLGEGTLSVARHQPFQKQPHHGTVELVSGEIGDDIAHYLIQSHQIRSLVYLGVYLDTYGQVLSAGGVVIEVMPGVEDDVVDLLYKNAQEQKESISALLLAGSTAADLVAPYFKGLPFTELDHNHPIEYYCPCTKERVLGALEILGLEELNDMIEKNEKAQITCQVCGRPYEIPVEEIKHIKDELYKNSLH